MNKQVNVGVDIRDLRIAKTGARTYLEELVREFKKLPEDHIRFRYYDAVFPVYTGRNKWLKLLEHLRFFTWKQLILPLKACIDGCDVLFCTDYFVPYFSPGFKTVVVFHDAFFYEYPHHYNSLWLKIFRSLGVPAARKAFAVVTPTFYTQKRISHFTGIQENKIDVIYEGPKSLPGARGAAPPLRMPYLLHVGTMEIRKNLVNLLQAFLQIKQSNPDMKLVLIGQFSPKSTIDDREAILDFIQTHQLEGEVVFPGYVPDEELFSWYEHAFAYVFPSVNEGFGIPILEAFEAGCPVLVADNTCLPEVGADAVLSFDPYKPEEIAQRLQELINKPGLSESLRQAGKKRLEVFNWESAAQKLVALFGRAAE